MELSYDKNFVAMLVNMYATYYIWFVLCKNIIIINLQTYSCPLSIAISSEFKPLEHFPTSALYSNSVCTTLR